MPLPVDVIDLVPQLEPVTVGTARSTYLQPGLDDVRWLTGVKFVPRGRPGVTTVAIVDACLPLQDFVAAEGYPSEVTFIPFQVQERLTCSSVGAWSQEEINDWARAEATAAFSAALARVAMYGPIGVPSYPDFASQATSLGTGLSALDALALVEDGMAVRLLNNRFMVHMSPGMLTRLSAAGAIERRGDRWVTATGNSVVADAGYLPDPVAGRSTIYGTPPVSYVATPLRVKGDEESFNRVHNDYNAYVEGEAIVWYDTTSVVSATVTAGTVPAV